LGIARRFEPVYIKIPRDKFINTVRARAGTPDPDTRRAPIDMAERDTLLKETLEKYSLM
jgi:hypothetical protein